MINLAKKLSLLALRCSVLSLNKKPSVFFCTQGKFLDPKYSKIKEAFTKSGKDSN